MEIGGDSTEHYRAALANSRRETLVYVSGSYRIATAPESNSSWPTRVLDTTCFGLVAALACGTLVTVAMALMALATALYVVALAVNASSLAAGDNGPFGVPSVDISIGIQLVVMLGAASLAAVSTRRGWQALACSGR